MTPDQGIVPVDITLSPKEARQIGLRALRGEGVPEGNIPTGVSTFYDGQRLSSHGVDSGWGIRNNGFLITLTQDPDTTSDLFDLIPIVAYMNSNFPVFNNVYTHTPAQLGQEAQCTLPTLLLANAMNDVIYDGLETANIHLVQESDRGDSPPSIYNKRLVGSELVASSGEKRFLHDLVSHDPGSRSTPAADFRPYVALGQRIDQVGEEYYYDRYVLTSYNVRLAHAFDAYSTSIMGFLMDETGDLRRATLPDLLRFMMQTKFQDYGMLPSKLIGQSLKIIDSCDTPEQPFQRTIMRKTRSGRTPYFHEVRRRLRMDPSELQLAA